MSQPKCARCKTNDAEGFMWIDGSNCCGSCVGYRPLKGIPPTWLEPAPAKLRPEEGLVRPEPCNQGMKHDTGKPRTGLMVDGFALALNEVAKVTTFGAEKYAPDNWRKVDNATSRYRDAVYRHLLASAHERNDSESGLPHLAHAAWGLLVLLELDDQIKRGEKA
ncbi:dATP/dGTP diphosphohydrolase domain-containing protein [Allohahella sp. A8]|uniref:dATP/dGTP diphosphohydrolase domain-containing protein n=1 Tax=Allohahella sp. A8 TaxID=3141461 RepID=UPI003A803405